jgi:hypothetical protein
MVAMIRQIPNPMMSAISAPMILKTVTTMRRPPGGLHVTVRAAYGRARHQ